MIRTNSECVVHVKRPVSFPLKHKHAVNENHVVRKSHAKHRKKCPHVVHFNIARDWFETYSRIKKRYSEAPSTLIRFQTETELFCSVFKKICVHSYRFRIFFVHPHYNAVSVLKTLLCPLCA